MCADRAARVFAPAALDRVGSHNMARALRAAAPVTGKAAAIAARKIMGSVNGAVISALREAARACDPKATREIRALAAGRLANWDASNAGNDLATGMLQVCAFYHACPMCGRELQYESQCGVCGTMLS
jgi:hypothetical protein